MPAKIYGMRNGLEGLLQERYVELNDCIKNDLDIEILKRTPSSFLGTCRYKLPHYEKDSAVYEKLFSILKKLDIKHFFYIGGNDSCRIRKQDKQRYYIYGRAENNRQRP